MAFGACSGDSKDDTGADTTTSAPGQDAPGETTTTTGGPSKGTPSWAKAYETPGRVITTLAGTNFKVDVYQVGVTKATKSGTFVDPDTNKPIIAAGDDIVFVNYVITNTSTATIDLPSNLVQVEPKYADWPYLQGMDGITDRDLYAQMKVVDFALAPGNTEAPFAWEAGASFSYGTNFKYQKDSAITFTATLTPANAEGRLVHEQRQQVSKETKIS